VEERINPTVKHEHFEKPVVTSEIKKPIIQEIDTRETILLKE
jgi:hypothetical protein